MVHIRCLSYSTYPKKLFALLMMYFTMTFYGQCFVFLGPDLLGSVSFVFQHISQVESNLRTSYCDLSLGICCSELSNLKRTAQQIFNLDLEVNSS